MNTLLDAWKQRLGFYAAAGDVYAEACRLHAEADGIFELSLFSSDYENLEELLAEDGLLPPELDALISEAMRLDAEGDTLRVKGDQVWLDAVIAKHGNVALHWRGGACTVEGETYETATS